MAQNPKKKSRWLIAVLILAFIAEAIIGYLILDQGFLRTMNQQQPIHIKLETR